MENQTNILEDHKQLVEALDKNELKKNNQVNNILVEADQDWEVVDKKRKIKQKEKPIQITEKVIVNEIPKEDPKQIINKRTEEEIDIVEKLRIKNQINNPVKESKPKDPLENLLNNNKFEVVVKKKKKKNDGKAMLPGIFINF